MYEKWVLYSVRRLALYEEEEDLIDEALMRRVKVNIMYSITVDILATAWGLSGRWCSSRRRPLVGDVLVVLTQSSQCAFWAGTGWAQSMGALRLELQI